MHAALQLFAGCAKVLTRSADSRKHRWRLHSMHLANINQHGILNGCIFENEHIMHPGKMHLSRGVCADTICTSLRLAKVVEHGNWDVCVRARARVRAYPIFTICLPTGCFFLFLYLFELLFSTVSELVQVCSGVCQAVSGRTAH